MRRTLVAVHLVAACLLGLVLVTSVLAQPQTVPPAPPTTEESETITTSTKQELIAKFLALNPDAHLHSLNMPANCYADSAESGGLRLNRMWVSKAGTLLEIEGLPVAGRAASAVIRDDTFQIVHKNGMARLQAFEGASQLKDRRGGGAIVVKPAEQLLALFDAVDDTHPMRVEHTANYSTYVYFDAVDPHFKARYTASYQTALNSNSTPEQMKDFLVEFAANDPDNKSREVFLKLINAMRAQKTFEGFYNAYLLIQDPDDAKKALALARTDEHRSKMENMAVATLTDKNRLFDFDFRLNASSTSMGEGRCLMLCNYNFSANRPLSGQLTVRLQPTSPIKLKQGTYKVVISALVNMPRRTIRQSFWLGNYDGADDVNFIRDIAVTVSPPSYAASITPQLGSLNVAWFQRGSSGGYEGSWATANATVQLTLKSVELIP